MQGKRLTYQEVPSRKIVLAVVVQRTPGKEARLEARAAPGLQNHGRVGCGQQWAAETGTLNSWGSESPERSDSMTSRVRASGETDDSETRELGSRVNGGSTRRGERGRRQARELTGERKIQKSAPHISGMKATVVLKRAESIAPATSWMLFLASL